jgi:hypothetical protein
MRNLLFENLGGIPCGSNLSWLGRSRLAPEVVSTGAHSALSKLDAQLEKICRTSERSTHFIPVTRCRKCEVNVTSSLVSEATATIMASKVSSCLRSVQYHSISCLQWRALGIGSWGENAEQQQCLLRPAQRRGMKSSRRKSQVIMMQVPFQSFRCHLLCT